MAFFTGRAGDAGLSRQRYQQYQADMDAQNARLNQQDEALRGVRSYVPPDVSNTPMPNMQTIAPAPAPLYTTSQEASERAGVQTAIPSGLNTNRAGTTGAPFLPQVSENQSPIHNAWNKGTAEALSSIVRAKGRMSGFADPIRRAFEPDPGQRAFLDLRMKAVDWLDSDAGKNWLWQNPGDGALLKDGDRGAITLYHKAMGKVSDLQYKPNATTVMSNIPGIPGAATGDTAARFAQLESSNKPNATNLKSSASGLYQFTDPTWNSLVKKYGAQIGITAGGRKDRGQQDRALAAIMPEYEQTVARNGLGSEYTYAVHVLGAPKFQEMVDNPDRPAFRAVGIEALKANKQLFLAASQEYGPRPTSRMFIEFLTNKYRAAAAAPAPAAAAPAPAPAAAAPAPAAATPVAGVTAPDDQITIQNSTRQVTKKGGMVETPASPSEELRTKQIDKVREPAANMSRTLRLQEMRNLQEEQNAIRSMLRTAANPKDYVQKQAMYNAQNTLIENLASQQAIDQFEVSNDPRMLSAVLSQLYGENIQIGPNSDGTYYESINGQIGKNSFSKKKIISENRRRSSKVYHDAMKAASRAQAVANDTAARAAHYEMRKELAKIKGDMFKELLKKFGISVGKEYDYYTDLQGNTSRLGEGLDVDGETPTMKATPVPGSMSSILGPRVFK